MSPASFTYWHLHLWKILNRLNWCSVWYEGNIMHISPSSCYNTTQVFCCRCICVNAHMDNQFLKSKESDSIYPMNSLFIDWYQDAKRSLHRTSSTCYQTTCELRTSVSQQHNVQQAMCWVWEEHVMGNGCYVLKGDNWFLAQPLFLFQFLKIYWKFIRRKLLTHPPREVDADALF